MKNTLITIAKVIAFTLFVGLVIYGQQTISRMHLLVQLIGLAGIIFLLWNYNRKFV